MFDLSTNRADPEEFTRWIHRANGPPAVIAALIEVVDTAEGCLCWFKSQGLETSAADVMTMTGLVLDQAKQKKDTADSANA
jgi:hypothetical protein